MRVQGCGGPEQLGLEEVEEPRVHPPEVLVRVHAAGVNPVDTYIRSGAHAVRPARPCTPGRDAAGVVAAAGEGVPRGGLEPEDGHTPHLYGHARVVRGG